MPPGAVGLRYPVVYVIHVRVVRPTGFGRMLWAAPLPHATGDTYRLPPLPFNSKSRSTALFGSVRSNQQELKVELPGPHSPFNRKILDLSRAACEIQGKRFTSRCVNDRKYCIFLEKNVS